jgi:predicted dehydrogenase
MKFLVIGCGSIGQRHIRNLLSLEAGEILAVDVDEYRLDQVARQSGAKAFKDLATAWKEKPDVSFITTPTSLHLPMALEAARHGCHMFIEKPLAHTLDGVDELLDLVRGKSLVTLVGCNMRFHPGLQRIKTVLEESVIGLVVAAQAQFGQYLRDWHPHEDYRQGYSARKALGGGVILDAIHELDYIRWLLGEVREVFCYAGHLTHLEIDTEDVAAILLKFANGAIGEVHLDYIQRSYHRSCKLIGEEGTIIWDYSTGQVKMYLASTGSWTVFDQPPSFEPNQMYLDELRHFLRCVRGEEEPTLDVFEGKRVLEIALAAKQSATLGRPVSPFTA